MSGLPDHPTARPTPSACDGVGRGARAASATPDGGHADFRCVGNGARRGIVRSTPTRGIGLWLAALLLAGCASRTPVQLRAVSAAAPVRVWGDLRGVVSLDGELLSLRLDSASVQYLGLAASDSTPLEDVTVRAVVASDSAGRGIPQGVSGALQVADVLRVGERRTLTGETLALPLPPGVPVRGLWLAFQFRGTARPAGREPELVIAYACSETNLLGATKGARLRTRRMRAGDVSACQL